MYPAIYHLIRNKVKIINKILIGTTIFYGKIFFIEIKHKDRSQRYKTS